MTHRTFTFLSNDKKIIPPFGRLLLLPFLLKKYFRSPAMQRFFKKNWKQNKLDQFDGLSLSSLLSNDKKINLPFGKPLLLPSLLILSLFPLLLFGQVRQHGVPLGMTEAFLESYADQVVPTLKIPLYTHSKYKQKQAQHPDFEINAIGQKTQINMQTDGDWILLENGDRLWRLRIAVKGAESLTFLYDDFWLPNGGKFYIYAEDESQVLGAFTSENNKESGRFSTAAIASDVVYLEYFQPLQVEAQARISIQSILQKPKNSFNQKMEDDLGFGTAAPCHININCEQGNSVQIQKRGTARIVMMLENEGEFFEGFCSGSLMNTTAQDQTPYILSAYHCLLPGFIPLYDVWQFDFGYESFNCDNPINEPQRNTVVGCEMVAGRQETDFLLLKLSREVPSSFFPYYCGWNATRNQLPRNCKMISHPKGDIQKVTVDNRNTTTLHPAPINWAEYTSSPNTHYRVEYDEGFSEQGGSGSGLLGDDGLVYGQLHGGNVDSTTCRVNRLFYGSLAESYDGNRPNTRLKDWLNPTNEDITTLQGFDPFDQSMALIFGSVRTPTGDGINLAEIEFRSSDSEVMETVVTNIDGTFEISIPRTKDYQIRFSKTTNISNGVSTFDLVQIRQHVLGVVPFDSVFKSVAADINLSNSVTTFDLVEVRKAILGIYEQFPLVPSWGFVAPEGFIFDQFTVNSLDPVVNFNVIAVKMGDVNFSADPSQ